MGPLLGKQNIQAEEVYCLKQKCKGQENRF